MSVASGIRCDTAPEPNYTRTDHNLNLTLPGTTPGGQGRSGVKRGILRESPDSAANLRTRPSWISIRPMGTPEVGQTPPQSISPAAAVASDPPAAPAAHTDDFPQSGRALPLRPSPPLPDKPSPPPEFLPQSASSVSVLDTLHPRRVPVPDPHSAAPAMLLAPQPPAGSVSVLDTNRSSLSSLLPDKPSPPPESLSQAARPVSVLDTLQLRPLSAADQCSATPAAPFAPHVPSHLLDQSVF